MLSNELGVSATLYLGAEDVLKLRALLESSDESKTLRVLERLKSVPMTRELRNSTRIDESVAYLRDSTEGLVSALAARIVEVWEGQMAKEAPQPKPKPAVLPPKECPACRGQHRAHTCGAGKGSK